MYVVVQGENHGTGRTILGNGFSFDWYKRLDNKQRKTITRKVMEG